MKESDLKKTIERYNQRIDQYGYSEKTLGWSKNKNEIRFDALIKEWGKELENSNICDFGCGFGDFYQYLKKYQGINYLGIDINQNLINIGKSNFPDARFWVGNILENEVNEIFDYTFSSGVFNHKLDDTDEYDFIESCLKKINSFTTKGFAVNFLSDKVDYFTEHNFNANPGKILEMCYQFSNNIVLRNSYMPFEFTVYIKKDIEIDLEKTIYKYD
jgi:SAM-dependent methyltransferase